MPVTTRSMSAAAPTCPICCHTYTTTTDFNLPSIGCCTNADKICDACVLKILEVQFMSFEVYGSTFANFEVCYSCPYCRRPTIFCEDNNLRRYTDSRRSCTMQLDDLRIRFLPVTTRRMGGDKPTCGQSDQNHHAIWYLRSDSIPIAMDLINLDGRPKSSF